MLAPNSTAEGHLGSKWKSVDIHLSQNGYVVVVVVVVVIIIIAATISDQHVLTTRGFCVPAMVS